MFCNWATVWYAMRIESMKSAFGSLTGSQAAADAFFNTIIVFAFVPMLYFNIGSLIKYSFLMGHLCNTFYDISLYSHFFMSLNRLCAVFLPFRYDSICSQKNTLYKIALCWIFSIVSTTYAFEIVDCRVIFDQEFMGLKWTATSACAIIGWYFSFLKQACLILATVSIDVITVLKVHLVNQDTACLQAFVFATQLLVFFLLSPKYTGKWPKFLMGMLLWTAVHTSDGLIAIFTNKELKRAIGRRNENSMVITLVGTVA
ncbi:unnamed protein product [Caenorhabditis auriculariae]|uniref:G-protein coupled receptors family 1 profile domain-containing protein n=1 Tax=Caenorhabditis auriculariae TaxID=2777116 RepID=A0A8S1HIC2_9PELO|nr:unnamed protein product [Caenorhabditis auriculariae]